MSQKTKLREAMVRTPNRFLGTGYWPIFYEPRFRVLSKLWRVSPALVLFRWAPFLARRLFKLYAGERIIEYPFTLQNAQMDGKGRILDLGCYATKLPIEFACLGYEVVGLDLDIYPLRHPNLTFVQGDIRWLPFRNDTFDMVTAVSTLEHIGFEPFEAPDALEQESQAFGEVARVLKKGGRAIITTPFGESDLMCMGGKPYARIHDSRTLDLLLSPLRVEKIEFAVKKGQDWMLTTRAEAEKARTTLLETMGVALVVASKE